MVAEIQWWTRLAGEIRAAGRGEIPIADPVRALRDRLGYDCAALVARGFGGEARTALVNLDYPDATLAYLTTTYSRSCPVHRIAVRDGIALRFIDVPFDVRETRTYRDALQPNGFREGLTLPLACASKPGFLAMSSTHPTPLDDESRLALTLLSHDLAGLTDPGAEPDDMAAEVVVRIARDAIEVRAGEGAPLTPTELRITATCADAVGRIGFQHRAVDGTWWHVRAVRRVDGVLVRMGRAGELGHLTGRELDVIGLVARGWPNERIASALGIAVRTVRSHIESTLVKIACPNRTALARMAFEREFDTLDALRAVAAA
ncbi:LuxR family transcriptional regulator [Nocardia panacis]|uniref:LuxR family transcriptional regulator n=1 Tax=Nocardia panacis TaxID=2340916 RepID=A0A3A4K5B3_9NOCA|nr:helix-turn-helix transcriptional regulator [Nocardia panacis]RJO73681.1 LuxR family transcriptional regulator [Nocardia panacis]